MSGYIRGIQKDHGELLFWEKKEEKNYAWLLTTFAEK